MLFELYYRNYATEGDVDLNEYVSGEAPVALESLARQRLTRKMRDAGKTRKTQKRKDGLSL
jgi:hypothetical protein